ncbi:MAG: Uma2 family endonuclease [Oscillospiraceae bacterium]|nr:Uma2 family endonuclease [Oscillospiraceae bacterium]
MEYMEHYMEMSTTWRHSRIITTLSGEILNLLRKKEIHALQEECALVHWGKQSGRDFKMLVDIDELHDIDDFVLNVIDDLEYVQPDFLFFKNNKFIGNKRETRIAGAPDLIAEVWSKGNSNIEREFKTDLYSSSPLTEHWHIEQDSNNVICYLGKERLKDQSLTEVLKTLGGIEFDLKYLAL